jgi:type II secretion system protein N
MKNSKVSIDAIKQKAWKNKKWLGYILFAILLTASLLYYRFPSDAFRNYLQATAERINSRYLLSIGYVSPTFPPGFSLRKTKLSLKINPDDGLFMADSVVITPEIWSFLKGRSGYRFKCLAYRGVLKGSIHFFGNSINSPFSASADFKDIRIDDYSTVSSITGSDIKGVIEGTIEYSGQLNSLIDGAGEAKITVSNGRVKLPQPILSFESIDFDVIRMTMSLNDQKIYLKHVGLKWQEIAGELSGTIFLTKEISKSRLNLKGAIELLTGRVKGSKETMNVVRLLRTQAKNGKLNFIVGGTFSSPTFRLL